MEKAGSWQLSLQDWEQIFYDFKGRNRSKWLSQYPGIAILEQALYIVAKKDYPFKAQMLSFVEENVEVLIGDADAEEGLGSVVEALQTVLDSTADGVNATSLLKEHMMTTATVAMVVLDGLHRSLHHLQELVEVLLGVINRPNHGLDRQARGTACECLRELEKAYPCLLHACAGHILFLFQSERTHVAQNYTLLLTAILHNLACYMYTAPAPRSGASLSFLSTSAPLTPFSVPTFLVTSNPGEEALSIPLRELTPSIQKEFRRVVGLLLERPQLLTSSGILEFVSGLIDIAAALELQGSILKLQLYSLLHTFSPLLCHIVLMIYFHFMTSFKGEEFTIFKRLNLLCSDPQQPNFVRLLAVHWLLGLENLLLGKDGKPQLAIMASSMYPLIYEPLSLKALKLDTLAYSAACVQSIGANSKVEHQGCMGNLSHMPKPEAAVKLFKDGSVCFSSFRWLPSWSSETLLMFRMMQRFFTVAVMHSQSEQEEHTESFDSTLFKTLKAHFISLALDFRRLVPRLLMLVDRFLLCDKHKSLGQHLLQTLNEDLLNQVIPDKQLPAYFPILERITETGSIPPGGVVDLLTAYIRNQVEAVGTDDLDLWVRGSQVLLICRTVMVHHYCSRVYHCLSNLLAFLVFYFPDFEIQDSARTYLRILASIPGDKLRDILKYGDQRIEDPQFSQVSSLLQSAPPSPAYKQSLQVSSYVHLTRATELLVGQSWSLVLHDQFQDKERTDESVQNNSSCTAKELDVALDDGSQDDGAERASETVDVSDTTIFKDKTDTCEFELLEEYFSLIPDYVNGSGLRVKVQCYLKFRADAQPSDTEEESPRSTISGPRISKSWPSLYAIVLSFSTPGPYGPIPSVHIPFLMSEPLVSSQAGSVEDPLPPEPQTVDYVEENGEESRGVNEQRPCHVAKEKPVKDDASNFEDTRKSDIGVGGDGFMDNVYTPEQFDEDAFKETVVLDLEPKQPVPTIVDAQIVTSDEEGRQIQGPLESIPVGIEDLFLKAPLPTRVSPTESSVYYHDLFNVLWEACGNSEKLHPKSFPLSGGKEIVSIAGTESVKVLESRADRVVDVVEQFLSLYVVSAKGRQLIPILKESGMLKNIVWEEDSEAEDSRGHLAITYGLAGGNSSNQLDNSPHQDDRNLPVPDAIRDNIGSLCILLFLPPRFHILMKMDIADWSTLVHVRTDYWPSLAYLDEFLEALVTSG